MSAETIQIEKAHGHMIYNNSNDAGKAFLEKQYGKDFFKVDVRSLVKSFEDGLQLRGVRAEDILPTVPDFMKPHERSIHAFAKLVFLAEIFNEGWTADHTNPQQYKYYPWFEKNSGSGLSFHDCGFDDSLAYVASRLCFKTADLAKHFGKQFEGIYSDYLLQ